ncbi:hypothetical protein [Weissella sagaensis]|uniref:hypothetical protein n=1 Tax=Weissella sagaensis TaxID=2559928 RepID=UPI0005A8A045|nr:hypothetical protein [Weissella sagaensis]QDJ58860.1 hypothetical protein EFA59_04675 [Weissella hellenica]QEA57820.1 hypothetical protein FGL75_08005 [Weissella hellenica]
MKRGKYYVIGLAVLLLIGGGTGIAINHNNNEKVTETHKNVKSSSSRSNKTKKHNMKKNSSSKSSSQNTDSSSINSNSSQPQASSSVITDDTTDSGFAEGQPTSNTALTAFLNKYGVSPAQWLVQNKGMSIEDALYATPDEQETSGELQTEWAYKQGTHDSMVSDNDIDQSSPSEEDDDYYYSDDDQYDDSGNAINKSSLDDEPAED